LSDSSWDLVVPVLVIGLALGAVWVLFWRRRSGAAAVARDRDQALAIADLEARQALLMEQLREAGEDEREELELAAARNLMALEQAGGGGGTGSPTTGDGEGPAPDSAGLPATGRRGAPGWLGFLGGAATAGLIAVLIIWAGQDATPRPDDQPPPMQAPQSGDHPEGPQIDARDAAALEALAQRMADDPTDLMARKQYAVGLLSTGQFFPAFEQAEVLLASNPRDPDGLYVKGMVRMRMGMEDEARALLGVVLEDYPDHIPGLTAMGVLALRNEGLEVAEEYWKLALDASGGSNPEIESLIAAARDQVAGLSASPAPSTPPASPPPSRAPEGTSTGPGYTVHIELAEGSRIPATAMLFVSLRSGGAGPPVAARRIERPRFPLTVTLSAADSMMGQPLPDAGSLFVRVDFDGSASTRDEAEPTGSVEMSVGESARLTLQ